MMNLVIKKLGRTSHKNYLLDSDILEMSHDMTKPTKWVCAQRRLNQPGHPPSLIRVFTVRMKKTWVLSTHWAHSEDWSDWAAKPLIRLGECPGWSETSLGAHTFCWFCHVVTQMFLNKTFYFGFNFYRISQLLTCLVRTEGRLIMNLLSQVGRMYPQAVYFPIRTLYLTLKIEQRERCKLTFNCIACIKIGMTIFICSTCIDTCSLLPEL